jgi:hypothetical protein
MALTDMHATIGELLEAVFCSVRTEALSMTRDKPIFSSERMIIIISYRLLYRRKGLPRSFSSDFCPLPTSSFPSTPFLLSVPLREDDT